ncbi:dynamin family protein [Chondromyces crocatus]|uniref:Dynamin N-terminal domain-containing protein n=1 Tax=Chondromyces crocatus TaxID=52 RepID=A0A0K1EIJ9_CHOCO|nr:dynamin family protein [Chondromyces crocatus]AKT40686.1 uncharacterized protein CMC5_048420 [Chondromyces crocatus]
MARLVEALSRFFGRVEILALGLEEERLSAEAALAKGDPLAARAHARTILASLPGSAVGFALWAEAAEEAWLDHEAVTALGELSKKVPWRADVWLRLGRAGLRNGWAGARDALERAASAPEEREAGREALLELCDLDLAGGDPDRAQRWLDRIPSGLGAPDPSVALRRAECALARGEVEAAREAAGSLGDAAPVDGRSALVRAQLALIEGRPEEALDLGLRGLLLEAPGAAALCAAMVSASRDVVVVDRARQVVRALGVFDEPAWAAAFASAEGRREDARKALARGLAAGDRAAAVALLRLSVETRDLDALQLLAARDRALLPAELWQIVEAVRLSAAGQGERALDALDAVVGESAGWADELRYAVVRGWIPLAEPGADFDALSPASWPEVLSELRRTARALDRLDLVAAIEALAVERERPLRVAVVGEFNAGKSTFINALLGEDVAPTGVLPTTATMHWVAWAPDPFARVVARGAHERVVPHGQLKVTLRALEAEGAAPERVFIYAPIERLKRVEILDTPGFNAPDPDHAARARQAFDEAHVAVWLLDATSPMKESERKVLADLQALGVPTQILANKADRLREGGLAEVLEHVRQGLADTRLVSLSAPIAFSAKLSLKGRMGDEAALVESGWAAVEALFSEHIVDHSEALRERGLRRKASQIATELEALSSTRAAEDREAARRARARAEGLRAAGVALRRERRALAGTIEQAVSGARRQLALDLRPIAELPEERKHRDPGMRAYAQERFIARLSGPLSVEIAKVAQPFMPEGVTVEGRAEARARAQVRAVLMGVVSVHPAPAELSDQSLEGVVEAAVDAFALALLSEAEEVVPSPPSAALELRAQAVKAALGEGAEEKVRFSS